MAYQGTGSLVEDTIERVGLPVTCGSCGEKGFVKPRTDYGGWLRRGLGRNRRWYCPAHADKIRKLLKKMEEKYATPPPEPTVVADTTEELYKLLD